MFMWIFHCSIDMVHYLDWFLMLNDPPYSMIVSSSWSWCIILLCCLIQFAYISFRNGVSIFISGISLLPFLVIAVWIWHQSNTSLTEWVGKYCLLFYFLVKFVKYWYQIFQCLVEVTSETHVRPRLFFVVGFYLLTQPLSLW